MNPMTETRDIGDRLKFRVTFRDEAGAVTDPTSVVWKWRRPNGAETPYTYMTDDEVARAEQGIYTFDAPPFDAAGEHVVRATWLDPDGESVTAEEGVVLVRPSAFATP